MKFIKQLSDNQFVIEMDKEDLNKDIRIKIAHDYVQIDGQDWHCENYQVSASWKPSKEQMRGLAHAINLDAYDAKRYGLDSLYSDLKKLM